jgi:hypothetical protein
MPYETIIGLPEGVKIVRIGTPRDGDYELAVKVIGNQEIPYIYQNRPGSRQPGTIIEPIEGYEMKADGRTGTFKVQKIQAPTAEPPISLKAGATVAFEFEYDGKPAGTAFVVNEGGKLAPVE